MPQRHGTGVPIHVGQAGEHSPSVVNSASRRLRIRQKQPDPGNSPFGPARWGANRLSLGRAGGIPRLRTVAQRKVGMRPAGDRARWSHHDRQAGDRAEERHPSANPNGSWSTTTFSHPSTTSDMGPQIAIDGATIYVAFNRVTPGDCGFSPVGIYVRTLSASGCTCLADVALRIIVLPTAAMRGWSPTATMAPDSPRGRVSSGRSESAGDLT